MVAQGRRVTVYTLAELAILLENYEAVTKVKVTFPGAKVVASRQTVDDPLDQIRDGVSLEETFDDDIPF